MSRNVVDSHLHLWDLAAGGYDWLTPDHGPLHRSFLVEEAVDELTAAGIESAILVQAEDSSQDTRYLLDVAARTALVVGVIGWVLLEDTAVADKQISAFEADSLLVGIRHLVHDDPRDDFLALPEVRASLTLLAERGLPFDVPNAWPRHLPAVADLADALPELTIVVDHLGKPPRGTDAMGGWEAALRQAAERSNVVAKLSGLHVAGQPFSVDALHPVLDAALDAFGASRLMYGGDWPMTIAEGGYGSTWPVMSALIAELSDSEQDHVLHSTASAVYDLGAQR
jgi:L-fuconolactonase